MKKANQVILFFIVLGTLILSCQPNRLDPTIINNIPKNIIVKEKSISGNFDSIITNLTLNFHSDSAFAYGIHDNIGDTDIFINQSRFSQHKFIYFSKDNDLRDLDGDSVAMAVLFDDDNRVSWVYDKYVVNYNSPFQVSLEINFNYDITNRLKSLPSYGSRDNGGGCNVNLLESTGNYYTSATGNDSLVLMYVGPSCGYCYYCVDTVIVTFLNTVNNTNLAILSFPSIPAAGYPSSNDYMQLMQFLPFPKLNGKLVDKIYYSNLNLSYTNSYTFDSEGRIKTAKIAYNYLYNTLKERLVEFNY